MIITNSINVDLTVAIDDLFVIVFVLVLFLFKEFNDRKPRREHVLVALLATSRWPQFMTTHVVDDGNTSRSICFAMMMRTSIVVTLAWVVVVGLSNWIQFRKRVFLEEWKSLFQYKNMLLLYWKLDNFPAWLV